MVLVLAHMLLDLAKGISDLAYNTDGNAYCNQKYLSLMYESSLGEVVEAFFCWLWPHLIMMVTTHLKPAIYGQYLFNCLEKKGQMCLSKLQGKRSSEFKEALFYGILLL